MKFYFGLLFLNKIPLLRSWVVEILHFGVKVLGIYMNVDPSIYDRLWKFWRIKSNSCKFYSFISVITVHNKAHKRGGELKFFVFMFLQLWKWLCSKGLFLIETATKQPMWNQKP